MINGNGHTQAAYFAVCRWRIQSTAGNRRVQRLPKSTPTLRFQFSFIANIQTDVAGRAVFSGGRVVREVALSRPSGHTML